MKKVGITLDDEVYKAVKMKIVQQDKTMKQHITDLIKKDLETKKEQTQ